LLKNKATLLIGLIVIGAFLYGAAELILLRLETGDVYPPYSSLRSDPLGTKAFYESLESCCELKVERNYEPFVEIKNRTQTAILFLGVPDEELDEIPEPLAKDFNSFVENGGRLVFSFLPKNETLLQGAVKKAIRKQNENEEKKEKKESEPDFMPKTVSMQEEWGFEFANSFLRVGKPATAKLSDSTDQLPAAISCHTSLYFRKLDTSWRVIYEREGKPLLIERKQGKGTIVLSSLSFFFSNEAMAKERHADLLAWIIGDQPAVIFDEYHHGISSSPGVASLARKYHLEFLFFGLLLLAGLFIWKNSIPLVPSIEEENSFSNGGFARGKESSEGLVNLLRRNIPSRNILSTSYQEWKKSMTTKDLTKNKLELIHSIIEEQDQLPVRQRNPLTAYNRISEALKERG
jgi:Domain of unknown function (DUF4350)